MFETEGQMLKLSGIKLYAIEQILNWKTSAMKRSSSCVV